MSKNYPVLDLCCMTCRKAITYEQPVTNLISNLWCKKKDESVGMCEYCDDWMPSKNRVKLQISRFQYSKERKY